MIYFIIVDDWLRSKVVDTRVYRGVNVGTDLLLMVCRIKAVLAILCENAYFVARTNKSWVVMEAFLTEAEADAEATSFASADAKTLARLLTAFGDEASNKTIIYNWLAEFKRVRVSLSDEFRDDRPSTAVNNKNIDAARHMIGTDRHVTYYEIWASLGIGMSQIQSILYKHLGMNKLCSRSIPHNLTEAQKTDRVSWCNAMLTRFKEGTTNLVSNERRNMGLLLRPQNKAAIDRMGLSRLAVTNQRSAQAKCL
ncbi:Histone-lysine N-methyltransferase SETMAR [Eumeta japonica]|uniref:Histone-lysine N-methyltransferase SETMAR n=1 Tax=Eumeta variegata TaxID=151549 RepID=A0A4C1W534_EUMVA|nr:Histone-lysine N-methyltransferase SETMAR [Eumeta japonica]